METDPATLARVVASAFTAAHGGALGAEAETDLAHRIETALRTAIRLEREGCAEVCAERAALWAATAERLATPAPLRVEASARANEATYLEDAIRVRGARAG